VVDVHHLPQTSPETCILYLGSLFVWSVTHSGLSTGFQSHFPFPISHLTVPSSQFVCQHLRFWALAPGFLVPGIWYLVWLTLIVNLAYGFFIFVARLDHKSYFAPGDRLRIRRQGRTHLRCLWIPFGAVVLRLRGLGKCNQSQIAEIII